MAISTQDKRRFTVVEGGGHAPSPWQYLPQTVVGRSPFNRNEVAYFRLSKGSIAKMDAARRRQPIFDAWTSVVGKVPPVNNSSILTGQAPGRILLSVADAHACYRGVKRAVGDDKHGFDTVAFVSRPIWGVRYEPSMSCILSWYPIPSDLVFVTYVKLDQPTQGRYGTPASDGTAVRGVVSHWQFVESDPEANDLPIGHRDRYRRRLW